MRHSVELLTMTAPTAALPAQKATPRYSCSDSMSAAGTPSEIASCGWKDTTQLDSFVLSQSAYSVTMQPGSSGHAALSH